MSRKLISNRRSIQVFGTLFLLTSLASEGLCQTNGNSTTQQTATVSSAGSVQVPAKPEGTKPEAAQPTNAPKAKPLAKVRVPGEFERQLAIILSVSDWQPHHFPILQQIVESTANHVNVLILYNDLKQLRLAATDLAKAKKNYKHVYFSPLELNTIWLRDFGPRLATLDNGWISIDFFYEGSRPKDDGFPRQWAIATGTRLRTVRWTVQGGNLLSNGAGLGITTERLFRDNNVQFPNPIAGRDPRKEGRDMVTKDFKLAFNLDELVVLQPLQNEATQHCDLFVTLIAPNRAVVASLERWQDPINSAILDQNARRLQEVRINGKPMEVHRIKVPPRQGTYWSPYTNVILANNLLLMPKFDSDPPAIVQNAIATYQRLLPGYTVKTIDMTSMKALQGSLHCLSLNLPEHAPWPKTFYTFDATIKGMKNQKQE